MLTCKHCTRQSYCSAQRDDSLPQGAACCVRFERLHAITAVLPRGLRSRDIRGVRSVHNQRGDDSADEVDYSYCEGRRTSRARSRRLKLGDGPRKSGEFDLRHLCGVGEDAGKPAARVLPTSLPVTHATGQTSLQLSSAAKYRDTTHIEDSYLQYWASTLPTAQSSYVVARS